MYLLILFTNYENQVIPDSLSMVTKQFRNGSMSLAILVKQGEPSTATRLCSFSDHWEDGSQTPATELLQEETHWLTEGGLSLPHCPCHRGERTRVLKLASFFFLSYLSNALGWIRKTPHFKHSKKDGTSMWSIMFC